MAEQSTADGGETTNRLIHETSPYLLQHARNPVDWFPWGEDAIAAARDSDRPIFLSIGYSACHWCHVMEHESFEDAEIAALMNRYFICIKVDREERPDLDQIYMNAVVALTGHGGWPMSVFLTPELKPFFGGTYWPPRSRMNMPGFADVLAKVNEAWTERRERCFTGADELTAAVLQMAGPSADAAQIDDDLLRNAGRRLLQAFDAQHGGFGRAPKFPHAMDLRVLLRVHRRFGDHDALEAAVTTCDHMARGGIYDHLGGGFHRYATDHRWLVPHFEKMLYDNALLASVYIELFQLTHESRWSNVVRETLDYVLREMTQPGGGFYSTQDADSEGVEGRFFVWTEQEIVESLGESDARLFNACYDVSSGGNWEGQTILNRPHLLPGIAEKHGVSEEALAALLARSRSTLFEQRSLRIAPGRDEKILVSWNGLMIAAMAQASRVMSEDRYLTAAVAAANFILNNMLDDNGDLHHAWKDGRARFDAYLDDYACLIDGLVDLYQATFDEQWLVHANHLADLMLARFQDDQAGGFFYTSGTDTSVIARLKDSQDNATPSGNGMAASALLRLSRLVGRGDLEDAAGRALEFVSGQLRDAPLASGQSLLAADFVMGPVHEVVLFDGDQTESANIIVGELNVRFLPHVVLARADQQRVSTTAVRPLDALFESRSAIDGEVTLYKCSHGTCELPVHGIDAVRTRIADLETTKNTGKASGTQP